MTINTISGYTPPPPLRKARMAELVTMGLNLSFYWFIVTFSYKPFFCNPTVVFIFWSLAGLIFSWLRYSHCPGKVN